MTAGKRALIVDDSRSARVILSRMLEQQGLAVDTAETAEQALEYLQRARPDVIFMDHLMPGMDGFQAVQTIKADPRTATIPLMMYTSQEGELYVSQARALGAIGVLPKTVRPVDVSRVLYQLNLLPDRRTARSALFDRSAAAAPSVRRPAETPVEESRAEPPGTPPAAPPVEVGEATPPASAAALNEWQAALRQAVQQLVKDQLGEHRRFVLATFEAFARRMAAELKDGLAKASVPSLMDSAPPPSPPARQWWPVMVTVVLGVVPAVVLGWLFWESLQSNARLSSELTALKVDRQAAARLALMGVGVPAVPPAGAPAGPPTSTPAPAPAPAPRAPAPAASMAIAYVPYGEAPLSGERLERLRGLAAALEAQHFRGTIRIETFVGDFCLTGSPGDGFTVADPALPLQKCDLVGNPFDDALSAAQRQSVAFASFVANLRQRTGGAIGVEVAHSGRRSAVQYPEQGEKTTAGEWNTAAAQNNRVEFRIQPAA
ncbi:MAG TPA: response regulator [Steroidobacteraceae bacterium]|nr:response regulator [Steroidobacteraceae bacterium]